MRIALLIIIFCTIECGCSDPKNESMATILDEYRYESSIIPNLNDPTRPSNLIGWYAMTNSFIDGMYIPGKPSLLVVWIDTAFEKQNETNIDHGETFGEIVSTGAKRTYQNARSGTFAVFLILLTLAFMISGWFTCGYRVIGLCGTRPGDQLDGGNSVFIRILLLIVLVILIILGLAIISYAVINTNFANRAFTSIQSGSATGRTIQEMETDMDYIDSWVANFSKQYNGSGKAAQVAPTREEILKAVTDAYRGYYGYVFQKAGLHLLEHEVKVLSKYTYFVFRSYYGIIAAYTVYMRQVEKVDKMQNAFVRSFNNFMGKCTHRRCDYYKPFQNNLTFTKYKLGASLDDFITTVSELGKPALFNMHYELVTKLKEDVLRQIPHNKSLYRDTVSFLQNSSDVYYKEVFKDLQDSIAAFSEAFAHLTSTLRLKHNLNSIVSAHSARHGMTIFFCVVLILTFIIILVGLALGCILKPRPISEQIPYERHNREIATQVLNVAAILIFVSIPCILIFAIVLFSLGSAFESEFCQFLTGRYPDGFQKLEKDLMSINNRSRMSGLFTSLLQECPYGKGTLFDMLQLPLITNWNTTFTFLMNFNRTVEDIYYVPDYLPDKLPLSHPFLNFCDYYGEAITRDVQTAFSRLPRTALNLKVSPNTIYESHEMPLEMSMLNESLTSPKLKSDAGDLYNDFVSILTLDLILDSLKKTYSVAHPWRYLTRHLQNVKDLYHKVRSWFYSPARVNTTKNMFMKFVAAALNRLFADVLKRDMPCVGIGTALHNYFYNFCNMIVDPWNATWLIFIILVLILIPILLLLFIMIVLYRKQHDRRLSDAQCFLNKVLNKDYADRPSFTKKMREAARKRLDEQKKRNKEASDADSNSQVAVVGFNRGCYICCRACTICTNFLAYVLLCKWKDRKKRRQRMKNDHSRRRSISELPEQFFPAPVLVPLGCGATLVGKCCCLNFEKKTKSEVAKAKQEKEEKKEKKEKEKKAKKEKKEKEKKKKKSKVSAVMDENAKNTTQEEEKKEEEEEKEEEKEEEEEAEEKEEEKKEEMEEEKEEEEEEEAKKTTLREEDRRE